MNHALRILPLLILCLALAACGGDKAPSGDGGGDEHGHDHGHDHDTPHDGTIVEASDHSMHFEIVHDEGAGLVKLWLYDGNMKPVTTSEVPVLNLPLDDGAVQVKGACPKGGSSATEWHFSHEALADHVHEARFRVLAQDRSYMVDLPHGDHDHGHDHDDHGHDHDDGHGHDHDGDHDHDHEGMGPHHGLVHPFAVDGKPAGFIELKLHDDKGDLELWIATDEGMKKPYDLSADARITVAFTGQKMDEVSLQVRNMVKNEDEDGVANLREGKTNYFIFPGDTGVDASWLQGKAFKATVVVSFDTPSGRASTKPFELIPHTH